MNSHRRRPAEHTSFWIPARRLEISWEWTSLTDDPPGSDEVAELLRVSRLELKGTVELKKLSTKTSYSAYLVFKLDSPNTGLDKATARVRFISKGKHQEDQEECIVTIDGENFHEGQRLPQDREKGWMEAKLGEFFNDLGDDRRSVEASLLDVDSERKSGLIVKGIEFRPNVVSNLRSNFSPILHIAEADPNSPSEIVSRIRSIEGLINFICEKSTSTRRSAGGRDSSICVDSLDALIDALSVCRVFTHEQLHKAAALKEVMNFEKNMSERLDAIDRKLKPSDRP